MTKRRAPTSKCLKDYRDFLIFLTYINPAPYNLDSEHEPALALCRRSGGVGRMYAIPLSAAANYVQANGSPTPEFIAAGFKIADTLGMSKDRKTVFKLLDAVVEFMPDLVDAPPWQVVLGRQGAQEEPNALITVKDGMGRKIHEGSTVVH